MWSAELCLLQFEHVADHTALQRFSLVSGQKHLLLISITPSPIQGSYYPTPLLQIINTSAWCFASSDNNNLWEDSMFHCSKSRNTKKETPKAESENMRMIWNHKQKIAWNWKHVGEVDASVTPGSMFQTEESESVHSSQTLHIKLSIKALRSQLSDLFSLISVVSLCPTCFSLL